MDTRRAPRISVFVRRWWVPVLISLFGTACQFSDIVAFRNGTEETLILRVEVEDEFATYNCDGNGSDIVRFEDEATIEIRPETRMCLEGPIQDPQDTYDVLDLIVSIEVSRAGGICLSLDQDALRDRFEVEGFHKTMLIDEEVCPP